MRNIVVCVGLSLFLAGCGLFAMPELGKTYKANADLMLVPQTQWNVNKNNDSLLWTKHGPLLDRLDIFAGLEEDDVLIKIYGKDNPNKFKPTMTSLEIIDLYKNSLTYSGGVNAEIGEIAPVQVAGSDGFEFEVSFRTADGLKKKGVGQGFVREEKLYLMVFTAPSSHYFDLVRDDALALMKSAHFKENQKMAKK
jgi:hypothetical protein